MKNSADKMTDRQKNALALIAGILVGTALLTISNSSYYQHWQFMKSCTENMTEDYCNNLWTLGNE